MLVTLVQLIWLEHHAMLITLVQIWLEHHAMLITLVDTNLVGTLCDVGKNSVNLRKSNAKDVAAASLLLHFANSPPQTKEVGTQTVDMIQIPTNQRNQLAGHLKTEEQLTSVSGIHTFKGFDALCDATAHYKQCQTKIQQPNRMPIRSRARSHWAAGKFRSARVQV
jgi:hypothetical protein